MRTIRGDVRLGSRVCCRIRLQADEGCDFDFLAGKGQIPEPEIH
jgi:hypothetical protein